MSTTAVRQRGPAPAAGGGTSGARTGGASARRWVPEVVLCVAGIGLGAAVGSVLTNETRSQLDQAGGVATFLGSLTGMVGAYLALLMVLLVSRLPVVERTLGQDRLARWHRRLAPWPITLLAIHAITITVGYAQAARVGVWHEVGTVLSAYPGVSIATAGLGLMLAIGLVSLRAVRNRLSRESWWLIHLWMYVALAISFVHAVVLGPSFVVHPLATDLWDAVWAAAAGALLAYRFGLPILRSLRHRLVVVDVRVEAPGVVSIVCKGRALDRLPVRGGQFLEWRFLAPGMWWQAHPYSLSSLPRPPYVRLTVKGVGDHSSSLARLRPGTRVAIEGPYGAFTSEARTQRRVALVAGGIGVTAIRSLLEDLPRSSEPVVVLRASSTEDLALRAEIADLVKERHGSVQEVVGARDEVSLDAKSLRRLVPAIGERDVFVSGPESFVFHVVDTLRSIGLPEEQLHYEAYAF
ncbi:MAG: ferredoxin reductase family protein [Actinomycetota bacterium]|nr:ferredoxin reductase family protein [Actinomycetota bacterium]